MGKQIFTLAILLCMIAMTAARLSAQSGFPSPTPHGQQNSGLQGDYIERLRVDLRLTGRQVQKLKQIRDSRPPQNRQFSDQDMRTVLTPDQFRRYKEITRNQPTNQMQPVRPTNQMQPVRPTNQMQPVRPTNQMYPITPTRSPGPADNQPHGFPAIPGTH